MSAPAFVCILARMFLKEPCGVFHVITLASTMIGICLTAELDEVFSSGGGIDVWTRLIGLASGLGAAISQSFTVIILRKIKSVHYTVTLFICSWVGSLETLVITYFMDGFHLPKNPLDPWLVMSVGLSSFLGQIFFTKSLQVEEAGIISVVQGCLELILAFLFQITIFHHIPNVQTIIGAIFVLIAVILTGLRKYMLTLPSDNCLRRRLSFILR